jgi:hypothetical protein
MGSPETVDNRQSLPSDDPGELVLSLARVIEQVTEMERPLDHVVAHLGLG